ncbi:hypothetical protein DPMN_095167 [Dreissena polymorpha]|uniref:HYR domain-containing protein n=1 Tax=Dreissena polymorpha TaxID=45954 RepID=A0A9D4L7D6_DREPO|nr:hypothetical protein DPMN_095167 [Dreissena polymorpha]
MVHWPEPVVKDNVDLDITAEKLSIINQGDSLEEGTYLIPYRATDSAGNSHTMLSECNVTIYVQGTIVCSTIF